PPHGPRPLAGHRHAPARYYPAATAAPRRARQRRHWLLYAGGGAALLLVGAWLVSGWAAGSRSVSGERVRIATVTRGDLVRDISAEGRVIAANRPTLFAVAGCNVTMHEV